MQEPKVTTMTRLISLTTFAAATSLALLGLANFALTPDLLTFAGMMAGVLVQFVGTMAAIAVGQTAKG